MVVTIITQRQQINKDITAPIEKQVNVIVYSKKQFLV